MINYLPEFYRIIIFNSFFNQIYRNKRMSKKFLILPFLCFKKVHFKFGEIRTNSS
jgi:hypothetical protein